MSRTGIDVSPCTTSHRQAFPTILILVQISSYHCYHKQWCVHTTGHRHASLTTVKLACTKNLTLPSLPTTVKLDHIAWTYFACHPKSCADKLLPPLPQATTCPHKSVQMRFTYHGQTCVNWRASTTVSTNNRTTRKQHTDMFWLLCWTLHRQDLATNSTKNGAPKSTAHTRTSPTKVKL